MSYSVSENLVNKSPFSSLVHKGFRLKADSGVGIKRASYVCPYCKKIYKTNPFVKGVHQTECKYCHTSLEVEDVKGYFRFNDNGSPYIYMFYSVQTILIGTQTDDTDGHIVVINGTIFEQKHCVSYHWDENAQKYDQKYNMYVVKYRTIFNLDQNQIYFVTNPTTKDDSSNGFSHFTLKEYDWIGEKHDVSQLRYVLYRHMIEDVFTKAYRLELPNSVKSFMSLSAKQCFYLMKFPVLSQYVWSYDSIGKRQNVLLDILYWLSNYDRKLRAILTCRDVQTYNQMWFDYVVKLYRYAGTVDDLMLHSGHTLYFFLAAWQMGHMGFQSPASFQAIESAMLAVGQDFDNVSIPLLFLFSKRNHAINKLYRRLIATHGEDSVVEMILRSSHEDTYGSYVYLYRREWQRMVESIDFAIADFSLDLDSFFYNLKKN